MCEKEVNMVLVFEIALVLVLFICLIYGIKYLLLLAVKQNADNAFEQLYKALPKFYGAVEKLISEIRTLAPENTSLVTDTQNLISQALNFSIEKDGNERIIAYANVIAENVKKLAETTENINKDRYNLLFSDFAKVKNKYNAAAKKLRRYADVFPTSFYARLKKITIMDYLN